MDYLSAILLFLLQHYNWRNCKNITLIYIWDIYVCPEYKCQNGIYLSTSKRIKINIFHACFILFTNKRNLPICFHPYEKNEIFPYKLVVSVLIQEKNLFSGFLLLEEFQGRLVQKPWFFCSQSISNSTPWGPFNIGFCHYRDSVSDALLLKWQTTTFRPLFH